MSCFIAPIQQCILHICGALFTVSFLMTQALTVDQPWIFDPFRGFAQILHYKEAAKSRTELVFNSTPNNPDTNRNWILGFDYEDKWGLVKDVPIAELLELPKVEDFSCTCEVTGQTYVARRHRRGFVIPPEAMMQKARMAKRDYDALAEGFEPDGLFEA